MGAIYMFSAFIQPLLCVISFAYMFWACCKLLSYISCYCDKKRTIEVHW